MKLTISEPYAVSGHDNTGNFMVVSYYLNTYRVNVFRYFFEVVRRHFVHECTLGCDLFGDWEQIGHARLEREIAEKYFPKLTTPHATSWGLTFVDRNITKG